MTINITDTFYKPYSFSMDFGRSPNTEIIQLKELIVEKGFSGNDTQVNDALHFIKETFQIIKEDYPDEISKINKIIKKEKITGGIIPPEILVSYETYKELIDLVINSSVAYTFINKTSGDRISKQIYKIMNQLASNRKIKKILNKYRNKIKKWHKPKKKASKSKPQKNKRTPIKKK